MPKNREPVTDMLNLATGAPLPSAVLAGQGVAGFVLRPTDLDRLPVLTSYPPDPAGDMHVSCRAIQEGERGQHEAAVARLRSALQAADRAAAQDREAAEARADTLNAEIARLTALLDDASAEADRADTAEQHRDTLRRMLTETSDRAEAAEHERDEARAEAVSLGQQLDACREQQGQLVATIAEIRHDDHDHPTMIDHGDRFTPSRQHPVALRVYGAGLVEYDGRELRVDYDPPLASDGSRTIPNTPATPDAEVVELYRDADRVPHEPVDLCPVDEDPRRPNPDGWPDDAVLLRYRELRALVALHLDRYCDDRAGRAMRDGDVPLRLGEVLDR